MLIPLLLTCSGLGLQLPVQRSYHREPLGPANFRLTSNIVCNAAGICGSAEISDSAGGGMVGAVGIQGGTVNAAPHRVTFRENESESKAEYCVGEKVDASEGTTEWNGGDGETRGRWDC